MKATKAQHRTESVIARKRNNGSSGNNGNSSNNGSSSRGELISIEARQRQRDESVLTALCTRMGQGDQRAVTEFYDHTVARTYPLALHICGDAATAEGAVESAYLQAWRSVGSVREGNVLGWLLRITRDCALHALHALQLRDPTSSPAADLLTITRPNSAIHHALSALTPLQRSAVGEAMLRNHQGKDLAEALGTSSRAATGALNAGLKRLAGG